jgi:tRNA/tmRNA/rRNA uracil-C5-methylase (TrmA/RlmC/RlmD family)
MKLITQDQVKSKIIKLRNQNVLLDSDVAELYGVETRAINQAVKRNLEKFPDGYLLQLDFGEWRNLKSQIVTSIERGGKTKLPTAFTERGLYMLATILKGPQAIQTTLAIIDAFVQVKELIQNVHQMANAKDEQKIEIFNNSADIISELLDSDLIMSQHETSFKLKLPFFEVSRKVTKVKNKS